MNDIEKSTAKVADYDERIRELIQKKKKAELDSVIAMGRQHLALFSSEDKRTLDPDMVELSFRIRDDMRRGVFTKDELKTLYDSFVLKKLGNNNELSAESKAVGGKEEDNESKND